MGATSAGGTAYPPGKPVHPQFLVGFVLLDFLCECFVACWIGRSSETCRCRGQEIYLESTA
jgi:hypothetical protein